MLAEGFGPGIGGRTVITVAGDDASDQAALDAFTAQLAATEGVAASPPPVVIPLSARPGDHPALPHARRRRTRPRPTSSQRLRDDVIPASGLDATRRVATPPVRSTSPTTSPAGSRT